MKLLLVISLIACGYAAKLDRAYLPPSSAATAGGSPGSLNAPAGPGSPSFGQPSGTTGFGQPAGFGLSGTTFGKSTSGPAFGAQVSGSNGLGTPSGQYGQPGSLDPGFSQVAQNFGGQGSQDYQRNQPQRAQASAEQNAEILRSDNQNDGETFSYAFETSNGIAAEESGVATNGVQAQGAFSYSGDDGQTYKVTYTADENGYQPQGDHLPTPPPIPEEILKSIEQNAQAAAAGTQEGAYDPNEDNTGSAAQQYSNNAPTSYGRGPSASFNQPQGSGPSQLYGAPNAIGAGSRPQSGSQSFQPQGPSQQYGTLNGVSSAVPSKGFGNGSPSVLSPSSQSQARPNTFGQSRGPSQQYGTPSRPEASGSTNAFVPLDSGLNGFATSGSASQPKPSQYQALSQSGFSSVGRPQEFSEGGDSGYNYDRPQSSSFGQSSSGGRTGQSPTGPNQPENRATQNTGSQGSFPRPTSNNVGYPSSSVQGSFSPSAAGSKGTFGPISSPSGAFGPLSGSQGRGSFGSSTGPNSQGTFAPSNPKGPTAFGSSASANGLGRPQGSFSGIRNQGGMSDSGYTYNQPGSQSGSGSQTPQGNFNSPGSKPGQTFGGPRQPPSFNEEEGYKY